MAYRLTLGRDTSDPFGGEGAEIVTGVELATPPPYAVEVHEHVNREGGSVWHLPASRRDWLCLQIPSD